MSSDFSSNYKICGLKILLNENCLLSRYYPLIEIRDVLLQKLAQAGCATRDDCLNLSDAQLMLAGLTDNDSVTLFKRFLHLYDYKGKGIKDIPNANNKAADEIISLLDLMRLPGVKYTRAQLYYLCGF